MRIALVNSEYSSSDGSGGIATYTSTMANALAERGHTVYVLTRHAHRPTDLMPAVRHLRFGSTPPWFLEQLYERLFTPGPFRWEMGCGRAVYGALSDICAREGLDIVEVPDYGGLARYLSGLPGCTVVVNFHSSSELVDSLNQTPITPSRRQWYRFEEKAIKNGRGFRCPSDALRKKMSDRYAIPLSNITLIRNPVSTTLFETVKKHNRPPEDRIDLLFAGRLEYRKGIDLIARNIRKILDIDPRITLTFAGASEIANAPDYRLMVEHSLSDLERGRIWFLGPVNRNQLAVLYCRSSMLLFPSLFENAPYVLLEAMAAGLPVIAASTGGIPEIIRNGENGSLFPADDLDALCGCIRAWIQNPAHAASCAAQAYHDIRGLCAPDRIAQETVAFYSSLVRSKER